MLFKMESPLRITVPCRILICGATGVGKSHLTANLILQREKMFSETFKIIYYCTKDENSIPRQIRHLVKFVKGLPDETIINNIGNRHILIIIDDLMSEAFSSQEISNIFLSGRHRNVSILIISQLLYPKQKCAREIALNCSHLVIFPNQRDQSAIIHLAKQVYPSCPRSFKEMYLKATDYEPFSYLMCSFAPNTPKITRFSQNIFADCPTIFINEDDNQAIDKTEKFSVVV